MQNQPVAIEETDETKRSSSHPSENNAEEEEAFLSMHSKSPETKAKNKPESKQQNDAVKRISSREENKHKAEKRTKNESSSHDKRPDLYIELEELHHKKDGLFYNSTGELSEHQWRIVSRWIKYEQTIDPETNMWSKPYVGALIYQNLAYLKTAFQTGTVILDSQDSTTFEGLMDEVITDIISRGHMNRDHRESLKAIILSQHRSRSTLAGTITKKAAPLSELFSSDGKHAKMFTSSSSSTHVNQHQDTSMMGSSFFNKFHHVSRRKSFLLNKLADDNNHADRNSSEEKEKKHSPVRIYLNESHGMSSKRLSIANNLFHLHHHSKTTAESTKKGVEAFLIMVGPLDFLDRTIMAFVRLTDDQIIDHLAEYNIRVRFLFMFFGPDRPNIDYHEIGRCMGTLMINRDFHDCAYSTKTRAELLKAITTFTNRNLCLVLPIGEYDEDILNPAMAWIRKMVNKKMTKVSQGNTAAAVAAAAAEEKKARKKSSTGKEVARMSEARVVAHSVTGDIKKKKSIFSDLEEKGFDPFKRTGCPFGSLVKEVEYRYSKYFSDIFDGLNLHCFIATIFGFTVCVAPALCFGGILADKTDQTFGVNEMLLATSINGVVYALLSGQPLMIFGATGPFLVFEEMLYKICQKLCIDFLASRIWVSAWVLIFTLGLLATESVHIIHNVTRFTEEIFAFLIACVFLTDAIKKIIYYFQHDPIYNVVKYCDMRKDNFTSTKSYYYTTNTTSYIESNVTSSNLFPLRCPGASTSIYKPNHTPEPNIALISLLLLIGTCFLALSLKKLRRSNFFGSYIRRTLSDVGILISIMLMVFVDLFIRRTSDINTQKLDIPNELLPTKHRSWFVSPLGNFESFHFWHPVTAILPAFIIFIVLFFEVELTGIMLTAKHRKVKKGTGFNLDLLLGALMMTVNSFFGLPWMCAAPVRTLAHWASLTVYTTSLIPGEKPKLSEVKEQRLTSFSIHILIFLCLQAKSLLRVIPVPVLFGVFLYFGIVSLSGTQLFERMGFIFVPFKYCPNLPHAVGIRPSKRNIFTIVQIIGVAVLLAFKSFVSISFLFPIVLVLLVPFRKFVLPRFFTHRELEVLDDENESMEDDMAHDFYELTHLPI